MEKHTTLSPQSRDVGERPACVVALESVESTAMVEGCAVRLLGRSAGAIMSGLNHVRLDPGATGPPAHCHALEEEMFYVLEGSGTLTLGADNHPLRQGDVVVRPPGTGVPHLISAGEYGMTYLAYGTRVPGDSVYYPDTGKVRLRALGVQIDASPS